MIRPRRGSIPADSTAWAIGLAIALFILLGGGIVHAQDVELAPKSKEPFISRIIINGNDSFSDKDLKRQMITAEAPFFAVFTKPRLKRDALRRDMASLQAFYRTNGFLEAVVDVEKLELLENGTFVDIIISVVEGEATRVSVVEFHGAAPLKEDQLSRNLRLKPGVPFNPTFVSSDIYAMKRAYFHKGRLAVEIIDSVSVTGKSVRLKYNIKPGPTVIIRKIEIRGNQLTKKHIVEREIMFKEGEVFDLGKAIETQRNLFESGLFTEAEIIPENLDVETRSVDVVVRLRERKSAYFEVGFGVGNILGSRVGAEWGDRNIFGRGRRVRLKVEYAVGLFEGGVINLNNIDPKVKYYRYDVEFGQRHVFGTKILLGINGYIEKDATVEPIVIRTQGAALTGARHMTPRTDLLGRLSDERITREIPDVGSEDSHTRMIAGAVAHDTRDFILDPHRGGYRDFRAELAGGPFGADNSFYTLNTSLQKYWRIRRSSVFAIRARIGFADAYGGSKNDGVPVENRYFTGGGNSVRGFRENSLGPYQPVETSPGVIQDTNVGGRLLLIGNAEVRFPLPYLSRYRFSAAMFADAGNSWRSLGSVELDNFRLFASRGEVTEKDFRYTLGLGLRYNTPVGPIRLDFGIPIKRDADDKFGRFHLSLGQIF